MPLPGISSSTIPGSGRYGQRRDDQMWAMPEWEEMRSLASAIKEHTLSHLDTYLEIFESNAKANGVVVHWAKDAAEHNRIVLGCWRVAAQKR